MRSLVLIWLVGAAACGDDPRVVLELTGGAPDAERVEVMLLDPLVLAKEQRHNDPQRDAAGGLETVFYLAERATAAFELGGAPADGFQLEIRDAGGPYVPLVVARAGDRVLAMGIYNPDSVLAAKLGQEHVPAVVKPVRDVTIYPIQLEPVVRAFGPVNADLPPAVVLPGEVMSVRCGAEGPLISGFVWRRGDGRQLRVLAAIPTRPEDRLDPPDLDCDQRSPGRGAIPRHDAGDQRDCDDTAFAIHGSAREKCSAIDEDCNPGTTLSLAPGACTIACDPGQICVCEDPGGPDSAACVGPVQAQPCKLPSAETSAPGLLRPCASAGAVVLPLCQGGCEVLLASVPEGLEVEIADGEGLPAHGPGRWVKLTGGRAWLSISGARSIPELPEVIVLRIRLGVAITSHAIMLQPFRATCASPTSELDCPDA